MKTRIKFTVCAACALLFALLIILLRFVDVAPVGPGGTTIGLSHINSYFFTLFGVNMTLYYITDYAGIAAIAVAAAFALLGLARLIKRKSLAKVDRELLWLGGLYAVVIGLYALFEVAVVNYRPILMPDSSTPEASFPSSHTMLVIVVMGSAMMMCGNYVKNKTLRSVLQGICEIILLGTVVGRLLSGVHWFTDILGGILVSASLLTLYSGITAKYKKDYVIRHENERDQKEVENLIRDSFWNVYRPGCYEHYVIHVLRDDPDFVGDLDFVMEKNGRIIGQNMFMKTYIESDDGKEVPVLTMGPICIAPALKRHGYGKKLLDYSLEQAARLGYGAVLFEGNIKFYGKSGFDYARKFGIRYHDLPEGDDDSFFLCRELKHGYLNGVTGVYQTPAGYYVKEEDVEKFDRSFPPKEKKRLPGQLFE